MVPSFTNFGTPQLTVNCGNVARTRTELIGPASNNFHRYILKNKSARPRGRDTQPLNAFAINLSEARLYLSKLLFMCRYLCKSFSGRMKCQRFARRSLEIESPVTRLGINISRVCATTDFFNLDVVFNCGRSVCFGFRNVVTILESQVSTLPALMSIFNLHGETRS